MGSLEGSKLVVGSAEGPVEGPAELREGSELDVGKIEGSAVGSLEGSRLIVGSEEGPVEGPGEGRAVGLREGS